MRKGIIFFIAISLLLGLGLSLGGADGQYYPSNPATLQIMVQRLLVAAEGSKVQGKICGLVCPHQGYLLSGIVAASGYKQVSSSVKTVFLLSPCQEKGLFIPPDQSYRTPLGEIPVSKIAGQLSRQSGFNLLKKDQSPGPYLEVQLPFLQKTLKRFELVPIYIGRSDHVKLAKQLIPLLTEESLIVVSSNLSMNHPYQEAVSIDQKTIKSISALDLASVGSAEADGKYPLMVLMEIAKQKGWQGQVIQYQNSGDTTRSKKQVTGFASIAFFVK